MGKWLPKAWVSRYVLQLTATPPPHLSASESAGGFSGTLPARIMTVWVWGEECFNLHLSRYLDHLRRACNLEVRTLWARNQHPSCGHRLATIRLLPLSLSPLQSPAKGRSSTCMFLSRGPWDTCIFATSSVVFLWEEFRGDCLDVRRWREAFLQFSVHAFYINLMPGPGILGGHHEIRMLKFYWT